MPSRILVIDDDPQIREMIREVLERKDHTVFEADNGNKGLRSARSEPVDIVITDIIMPDKDGLETIAELRSSFPGIKIIAISGGGRRVDSDFLPAAQAFGADQVLYKPFRPRDVIETIDLVAGGSKRSPT